MDKIKNYSQALDIIFGERSDQKLVGMETVFPHPIIDRERNEYLFMWIGWFEKEYVHDVMFHARVVEEKVIIYADHTDIDLKTLLIENGVPNEAISFEIDRPEVEFMT